MASDALALQSRRGDTLPRFSYRELHFQSVRVPSSVLKTQHVHMVGVWLEAIENQIWREYNDADILPVLDRAAAVATLPN